ncbi:Hsp70 family protein [Streptomyces sp. NBC_00006]|uniref:Hsp70 family protein n=1 Tax=Streptomyces sp. NBC_00006 TaxID=2975619 RepID=UPI00224E9329|nr:Hsp70 family protein [Streptomyces sp. NBC_00006]MCX5529767.1 Hsp70 family protein [Streptomyces sp. NBC_00006]
MTFGIDFGTSNSVVAHWNGHTTEVLPVDGDNVPAQWQMSEFQQLFPSALSVRDLRHTLCFGWEAKTGTSEPLDAVKRMLGTRSGADRASDIDGLDAASQLEEHHVWVGSEKFHSTVAAASLFSRMKEGVSTQLLDLSDAVVTVPANATGGARYRTRAAAALGGVKVRALLNEPTAAAISYVHDVPVPGRFLVFDWGGGTIDVTVLEYDDGLFEEQTSRGITALGGLEFDDALAKLIQKKIGLSPERLTKTERRRWRRSVELTKIALSSVPMDGSLYFDLPVGLAPSVSRREIRVTAAEYTEVIAPLISRALEPVQQALEDLAIPADNVDSVLMIGGTSQIPQVRHALGELLGHDRIVDSHLCRPMTAVARGAAIYAASLDGELGDNSDFSLVTSYDLGTAVSAGEQRGFRAIIRRNATLPAEGSATFYPDTPGASSVRVPVIEGEVGCPADSDRSFPLARIEVDLPTREQDIRRNKIEIRFRYNESGILRFTATHAETGAVLAEREIDSFGPDGTPLQRGLDDELTRLLAHTIRPFADGSSNVRHLSAAETANARPAPIDVSMRVVEPDPAVSVNGEAQGVVVGGF